MFKANNPLFLVSLHFDRLRKTYFLIFFTFATTLLFPQKVKIIASDNEVDIKEIILNKNPAAFWLGNYFSRADTLTLGKDSITYKIQNEETLLLMQKKGYKHKTQVLLRSKALADKKRVQLDRLMPLPQKNESNRYIIVDKVSFEIKPKDYVIKYYEGYANYLKDNIDHKGYSDDKELIIEKTIFEDYLNRFLLNTGFIDTVSKISFSDINLIKLQLHVSSLTESHIGDLVQIELKTKVKIINPLGLSTDTERDYVLKSEINYNYSSKNNSCFKNLIADALENVFYEILKDEGDLKLNFQNVEKQMKELSDKWSEIMFVNKTSLPINIENAAASVVTVKQKNGHGSGCIVSPNGYIITNSHVIVGADSSSTEVIFSDGTKKSCKIIRSNPFYDLALLKIDTTINSVLKINFKKNISLGADVYAIGTPKEIDLGQSVTKGIISGKRNFDNKIYIQSDVSVNKGNSGGAMINKEGELIGFVNAKLIGVGVEGVSFAIPAYYIEEALKIKITQ